MTAQEMWERYCSQSGTDINTPYETWAYGDKADNLAALTVIGAKTGTASAYEWYTTDPDEPLPKAGDYSVITDSRDNAQCIIVTTQTTVLPFDEITAEHAASEGEGDRSLAYWRQVHEKFFTKEFEGSELHFTQKTPVLCERFKVVYSLYSVDQMTDEQAMETCSWRYDGNLSVYNFPSWEECKRLGWALTDAKKRQNAYFSVCREDQFLGFFHIMDKQDHIELGVGIKPQSCGQHNGRMFMELALAKIEQMHYGKPVQLTVRPFNKRAIRCYESVGFRIIKEYYEEDYLVPGQMYLMQLDR